MAVSHLTTREIADYRRKMLRKQRGICPLCKELITEEEATLDHCHVTGKVRAALHRSCNGAEGKILHWAGPRSRGDDPVFFLKNLLAYWRKDFSSSPIHPTHGKPRRRKRRKKR